MSFFKKFKPLILLISVFVVCYSVVFYVSAVWTDAPGTPTYCPSGTTGCDAPINAGPTPQYKTGSLGVGTAANPVAGNRLEVSGGQIKANSDLTVAGTSYFANVNVYGNMGIGTVSSPGAKLDVAGNIKARFFEAGEGASSTIATVPGWYRIASNSGNRANAEFTLRDYISGGGHSTLTFRVGVSYNFESGFSFTLLNHNYYNILTFTKVRILRNTVYDSQYLEVYVARAGNVDFSIYDNLQSTGWTPVAWTDGEIPVGYTAREFNVNNLFVVGDYTDRFTVNRGGNVGIGTATPGAKLEVAGQVKITGGTPGDGKVLTSDINGLATWQTLGSGGGVVSGTGTQNYVSKFNNAGGTAIGNSLIFDNGTNVGIGTASPLAKLEVATPATAVSTMNISRYAGGGYASIKSTDPNGYLIMDSNGQAVGLNWYTTDNVILANGGGNVGIGTAIPSELLDVRGILPKIQLYDTTGGAGYSNGWIGQNKVAQTLNFGVFDMLNPIMSLKYGGNVGIGTTAPGAKLEVAGQVKITGGTPGTGKVLTSDVSGLATWQTPAVAGVSSVFGRTGAVVAASGDYTTTLVTEGTSLYFTNARAVSAVQSLLDLKAPLASPTFTGNVTMPGTGVWNSSGNVGIGTINPGTNKLEVSGGQLKADNDLTVSGTSYFANVNAYGTINLLSDTWLTGAGRTIVRDSYFGYSSGYRATQLGADLSVRDIAIGVDPTSVAGGAFTGTGEIALPNLVEFMQKNSGGTNWLQDVLALNNGNVGIGTTNPGAKLEVAGQVKITGGTPGDGKVLTSDINGLATWQTLGAGGGVVSGTGTQNYVSKFNNAGGTTIGNSLIFDNGTNVGIGTTTPTSKLEITGGQIKANGDLTVIGTSYLANVRSGGYFYSTVSATDKFGNVNGSGWGVDALNNGNWDLLVYNGGSLYFNEAYFGYGGSATIRTYDTNENLAIMPNGTGNVGIGTTNPVAKLEVAGTAKMTGFQLGTSATAGQVLTTDASGVGTWQTLGAGGGVVSGTGTQNYVSKFNNAGGTTIGNSLIFDNGTNVGIGTASPEQKLHVSGGNILLDNARTLQAKNSTGVVETWMWPRYSDNIMYTNYGASGWNIRNSSSVSTMFMNNSGDVGIGTVAPNAALQIVRDATGGELLRLSGYSPSPDSFYLKVFPVVGSNTVDYRFQTVDNIGGTKDMLYLDSSTGNVGIGTASPNTLLSLGGSLGMKLAVYDGGTAASSYGFGIQSGRMFAQNSAGNEVMVWTSGGNVGIGTTNPVAKLEVAGTAKMTGFQLGTSATAGQVLTTDASGVGTWQTAAVAGVSSVFGRTGAVVAVSGDYTTTLVTEGTSLYFTNARAQAAITGGASTITTSNLTASRALLSDASGKVVASATVSDIELGYLDGVSSAIQTQLNLKAPSASPTFTGNVTMPGTGIWNSSGNVGIGTTTPVTKLEVAGGPIKATGGLIMETRTTNPTAPTVGQIWMCTDSGYDCQ